MARRKKKLRVGPIFIALGLIAAVAAGSYYFFKDTSETKPPKQLEVVETEKQLEEKVEQEKNSANFKTVSLVLQSEVDKITRVHKAENQLSEQKSVAREQGGTIDWWQRQQLVTLDKDTTLTKFKTQLTNALKSKNGVILRQEQDIYNGKDVDRLDIAYQDTLGGEDLFLTVDKLYVLAPASPVKKKGSGKLAIVIDDCGYDTDTVSKMAGLRQDMTFAVIPFRQYSAEALQIIKHSGKEAMLHLPMEPLDASQQSEKETVTVKMSDKEIRDYTKKAIESLPGIVGVNNHQGSRATADERVMKATLGIIKNKGLFFLDSNTQPKTIGYQVAEQLGIKTGLNRAFLDGEADVDYIKRRMRQAGEAAIKNGSYIAICHARPKTVIALSEMVGELEEMGVELVFVSQLLS